MINAKLNKVPEIKDVCELIVDNAVTAIVKFKNETEDDRIKLLAMGCFNGTENLYCITKRENTRQKQYVKSIDIHDKVFTFDYGGGSETCVGTAVKERNDLIKKYMKYCGVKNID